MNWRDRGVSLRALGRLHDEVQAVFEAHACPEVRRLDAALDHHRAGEGG